MLNIPGIFLGKKFTPLNLITISRQRLIDNYHNLSAINPAIKIAPVLKSNAYGHGIKLVGEILDKVGAPFLCVDSLYEAFQLKSKAKVKTPLLIMGYIHPKSLSIKKLPFSFAVYDLDHARALNDYQKGAKVHIFVDTGMNREGVPMDELEDFLMAMKQLGNVTIEGIMSHLADSANPKSELTKMQVDNFGNAKKAVFESGFKPRWFHLGGTYGLLNELTAGCNLIRVGRAVYGISDVGQGSRAKGQDSGHLPLNLKPVLKHTSKIVQIKKIKKGEKVGYSGTFVASKDMTIGVLPLGYNDGVDRRLSNKGVVGVESFDKLRTRSDEGGEGKKLIFCPIIGLVSMNVTTIDLSGLKEPVLGSEAVIFSDDPQDPNSVVNTSKAGGVLPHEMLIHIAESTKRVVV